MKPSRAALLLALLAAGISPVAAQQFPTVKDHSVIGRLGTGSGSGPSQEIPFDVLGVQLGLPIVTPEQFGAKCDDVTDDAVALQNMLNASVGKTISIPPQKTCVTGSTLLVPSNTTIVGGGRDVSIIKGIGNALPIFAILDKSNVQISDLYLLGSDQVTSWAGSSVGAISVTSNLVANSNITLKNLKFSNFNTTYWNYIANISTTQNFSDIIFRDNWAVTATGDIPTDPTTTNNQNYFLAIYGGTGGINTNHIVVSDNRVEGAAFCYGVALFNFNSKYSIQNNQLLNIGNTNTVAHCTNGISATNSYAMLVYDINGDGHPPTDGLIQGNYIAAPYSAGIYFAGDGTAGHTALSFNDFNALISGNNIVGHQVDDGLAPRAAIAINAATNVSVVGNRLYGGHGGVSAGGQFTGVIDINANFCQTTAAVAAGNAVSCISIAGATGTTTNTPVYAIRDNYLDVGGGTGTKVLKATASATQYFGAIDFSNNKVVSSDIGVSFNGVYLNKRLTISENHFSGVAATNMLDAGSVNISPVIVRENIFDLSSSTTGLGMKVDSSLAYMAGNVFMNRTSGSAFAYSGVSATGTLEGFRFNNVSTANQVVSSSLGLAKPSFSAAAQDFVQNLNVAAGSAQTIGWINPTNGNNWLATNTLSAAGQLPGEPSTGSASAGNVGELITNTGSAVSLSNGVAKDVTTVSLTAGDWYCWGNVTFTPAGSTTTSYTAGWISTTANTEPAFPNSGAYAFNRATLAAGLNQALAVGNIRLSLSGTTTVSLGITQAFATSTSTGGGFLGCERRR